ncbi:UNVERIFIED_CONTAM: hypothetical protein FKN15_003543 [Acipenser sinensis]
MTPEQLAANPNCSSPERHTRSYDYMEGGDVRVRRLFCRTHWYLTIDEMGKIEGTGEQNNSYSILEIRTVSVGIVAIKGVESEYFLAMNKSGKLYGRLPLKIDIIKHPNETDGKSTAVHAKLIAPDDVSIYTYPCIPEYEDKRHEVVLVFPGPDSVTVEDITNRLLRLADRDSPCLQDHHRSAEEPAPKRMKQDTTAEDGEVPSPKKEAEQGRHKHLLKRVVFIDSTWNQTNKIVTDERLQALLQVELKTRKTCFWRHQKGSPETYLSTIEAIYYFLIDFHQQCLSEEYHGEYDNLLFFYSYMYKLINKAKHAAGKL